MPSAVLIVNLGAPFRIRAGTDIEAGEYLAARRRFLREHPGHALDVGPLPAD
jgi:hypothetical protein